jgi:hypothetical protein
VASKAVIAGEVALGAVGGYGLYRLGKWLYGFAEALRGSSTTGTGAGTGTNSTDNIAFAKQLVAPLTTLLNLNPAGPGEAGKIDRLKTFFAFRRARDLGLANATLTSGTGIDTLTQAIQQQFNLVDAFVNTQVGTSQARGPYYGAAPPSPPPNPPGTPPGITAKNDPNTLLFDLGHYASIRMSDPPPTTEVDAVQATAPTEAQVRTLRALDQRRMRVIEIVWKATAIDPDVWSGTGTDATLQEANLSELLDRRLRSLERMQYEASAGATTSGIGSSYIDRRWSSGNSPTTTIGPWNDDYSGRMFEAPSLPATADSDAPGMWSVADFFLNTSNSNTVYTFTNEERFLTRNWFQNRATNEFDWNIWPGTRLGKGKNPITNITVFDRTPTIDPNAPDGYGWIMESAGGIQASEILGNLFIPSTDWWQRTWLHSDGLISALFLEALRFAKLRREGSDDLFNALPTKYKLALDDYFDVRPKPVKTANGIMAAGRTDYFENGSIAFDDLQPGDQVLFESNPVLVVLGFSAWEYPTVLITDVETTDTSSDEPKVLLNNLRVQGFDSAALDYPSYQLLLAKNVDLSLKSVQDTLVSQIQSLTASGTPIPTTFLWDSGALFTAADNAANDHFPLRLWNPYGDTWNAPGPWWLWINLNAPMWKGAFGTDPVKILAQFPGGIVWIADDQLLPEFHGMVDPAATFGVGAGFQPPPWQDNPSSGVRTANPRQTIFVPLFEPDFGGWLSYFEDKASNPTAKYNSTLVPVKSDVKWLPGLAKIADNVRVIRPRVKVTT